MCAVAQTGRHWPYRGYIHAFRAVVAADGLSALFRGALPLCLYAVGRELIQAHAEHERFVQTLRLSRSQGSSRKARSRGDGGGSGASGDGDASSSSVVADLAAACLRHPFELMSLRLATSRAPECTSVWTFGREVYVDSSRRCSRPNPRLAPNHLT